MEVKGDKKKMVIYKEMQYGSKPSKYERENRKWVEDNTPGKSTSRKMKIDSCRAAGTAAGTATDKVLIANGLGTKKEVEVNAKKAKCGTRVAEFSGLELLNADAEAKVANASAGTSVTPVQAEASAKASGAEAGASAALVKDVIEVGARAVAGEAKARAGAGVKDLGARAEASAVVAKVGGWSHPRAICSGQCFRTRRASRSRCFLEIRRRKCSSLCWRSQSGSICCPSRR